MASVFGSQEYNVNGKDVLLKWIEADLADVRLRYIGEKTCGNAKDEDGNQLYGINGTFFCMADSTIFPEYKKGDLAGISVYDSTVIHNWGEKNDPGISGGRGTMVKVKENLPDTTFLFNKRFFDFPVDHGGGSVDLDNIQWAIGGTSLLLTENFSTPNEYYNAIANEQAPGYNDERPRTAIGYKGGLKVILCTFFSADHPYDPNKGCTLWDVRTVIKNKFGCTHIGINLDGGGSTQISYKADGQDYYHQTEVRYIYSMVTVPM